MKQKIVKILAAAALFMSSQSAMAIGQEWLVGDEGTHRQLATMTSILVASSAKDENIAGWQQKSSVTQSYNQASLVAMHDMKKAEQNAIPTIEKCAAITQAGGMGGALANEARANDVIRNQMNVIQNTSGNNILNSVANMKGREDFCSQADVLNGICKKEGKYSGWGDKVDSILKNPADGNFSLTDEQVANGRRYIASMFYADAPEVESGSAANTKQIAERKLFLQRISPSVEAYNRQLARSHEMELPKGSGMEILWNSDDMKAAYQEIRGKEAIRPKSPGLREFEMMLASRPLFYSKDLAAVNTATQDIEVLRKLYMNLSIANYQNQRILEELESMNRQLGAMNSKLGGVDLNQIAGTGK